MSSIPGFATANGDYKLDIAIELLRKQWREGKQIVVLVGAGISSQSGFPSLGPLGIHLLTLYALTSEEIVFPLKSGDQADYPSAPAFSLEKMGWTSPCLFPEMFGKDPKELIVDALARHFDHATVLKGSPGDFQKHTVTDLQRFASDTLGLSWFYVLDEVAGKDPRLVEELFDSIGTRLVPGAAHNLLSQFVSWMNVRLVLTTNFDSLIEKSLDNEGLSPYVFDVHVNAPPPARDLIQKHLSVVKLHGSHYGIRADTTINTPMDNGQVDTMVGYFDDEAILLVMDYSGNDGRMMQVINKLIKDKPKVKIIRVDPIATQHWNKFFAPAKKEPDRIFNLYYPHSRFFLLDVLQKCSGKLPNTQSGYPVILQTPVPHKEQNMFGWVPDYDGTQKRVEQRVHEGIASALADLFNNKSSNEQEKAPCRFAVITGEKGSGVSQVLSQVAERLYMSHQLLWCDLDEAVSVGTLVSWMLRFVLSRQPELPDVPMPLELPQFECSDQSENDLNPDSLARTAVALWDRLKRDRYYIVIDSVSYALKDMCEMKPASDGTMIVDMRRKREAKRLVLFLAMLTWCASRDDAQAYGILAIGTHFLHEGGEIINELRGFFDDQYGAKGAKTADAKLWQSLPGAPKRGDILRLIRLILVPHETSETKPVRIEWEKAEYSLDKVGMARGKVRVSGIENGFLRGLGQGQRATKRLFISLPQQDKNYGYLPPSQDPSAPPKTKVQAQKFVNDYLPYEDTVFSVCDNRVRQGTLRCFLEEVSLCNRPLAWGQMLALPAVRNFRDGRGFDCPKGDDVNVQGPFDEDASKQNIDAGTLALQALVKIASDFGLLRREQGAYYYMDGSLRDYLRAKFHSNQTECHKQRYRAAHDKILRFYERAYNISNDIMALNYFCYHSWRLLEQADEPQAKLQVLEQMGRGLLENSRAARGHLNAYDHSFLLLSLKDSLALLMEWLMKREAKITQKVVRLDTIITMLKRKSARNRQSKLKVDAQLKREILVKSKALLKQKALLKFPPDSEYSVKRLERQILKSLADLYECTEDASSGMAVLLALHPTVPPPNNTKDYLYYWHERQKIHRRCLNQYRSCAAGLLALGITISYAKSPLVNYDELRAIAIKDGTVPVEVSEQEIVIHALVTVLAEIAGENFANTQWFRWITDKHECWHSVHCAILRLTRTISRILRFEPEIDEDNSGLAESAERLLSAGKKILAYSTSDNMHGTKSLWTRYHCTSAFFDLYRLENEYNQKALSTVVYKIDLAKSYAVREGGNHSHTYHGAIADLHEAEAILWEGRMLSGKGKWTQAKARQYTVRRLLTEAQRTLSKNRLSLVWWREMPILACGAAVDTVRTILAEGMLLPPQETPSATEALLPPEEIWLPASSDQGYYTDRYSSPDAIGIAVLEEAISLLEEAAIDVHFHRPIVCNDDWRETRFTYQILRLAFYTIGILAIAAKHCATTQDPGTKSRFVTVVNRALRVLVLVSSRDNNIHLLPIMPTGDTQNQAGRKAKRERIDWVDTRRKMSNDVARVWNTILERLQQNERLRNLASSGLYTGSLKKMQTISDDVSTQIEPERVLDWEANDLQKWSDVFLKRTLEADSHTFF